MSQHMKSIPDTKSGIFARSLAALLLAGVMLLPMSNAISAEAVVQTTNGISYVSGGIGEDALAKMETLTKDFNLKLVFALQDGHYVTDVKVVITDAKGKTLLDATSEGPWFLVRLPAGNYQIVATFAGNTLKRAVTVGKARLQTVGFRWTTE